MPQKSRGSTVPNDIEEVPVDDTEPPLEVKVINPKEKITSWNDSNEDNEYDDMAITDKEIKEHEDGDT